MLLVGIAIFGQFAAVVYAAAAYWYSLIGLDSNPKLFFCTIKSSFSVAFPALQFVWWILLFRYLFVKSKDELLESVACTADIISDGTSASSISHRVQHSLTTIKDIVEMKRRVTCHYGSFVLLYPVGWLTALLHTCSLLSTDVGSVHVGILLVHAIASLFQFYLPFWSCQMAIISVSFKCNERPIFRFTLGLQVWEVFGRSVLGIGVTVFVRLVIEDPKCIRY